MTVSKTALDKAIETVWTWPQAARLLHGGIYDELVERVAQFAESLSQEATAELQKENARLASALRTLSAQAAAPIDRHIAYTALNPPKGGAVQEGLSKEKE